MSFPKSAKKSESSRWRRTYRDAIGRRQKPMSTMKPNPHSLNGGESFGVVDGLGYLYCNDHAFCAKGTPSPVYGFPHSEEPCDSCGVDPDATLPRKPAFLLMSRRGAIGSPDLIGPNDKVTAIIGKRSERIPVKG
jgi:hypothetical protein